MLRLTVFGFDSKAQADAVWNVVEDLDRDGALSLRGLAMAWRDDRDRVRIEHGASLAEAGATEGGLAGAVIGFALLAPLLGAVVGALAGATGGKLSELGLDQLVVKRIAKTLEPGHAALFALSDSADADRVIEALRPHHPTVIETNLPDWEERDLIASLTRRPAR